MEPGPDGELAQALGAQMGGEVEPIPDALLELTSRELEVLRVVAAGEPNKQIAAELAISERTARTHVSRLLRPAG
jgi:DNA-binding NarL/FixJ family response regulator